jgi:hypothetical protein
MCLFIHLCIYLLNHLIFCYVLVNVILLPHLSPSYLTNQLSTCHICLRIYLYGYLLIYIFVHLFMVYLTKTVTQIA